jgi:hypothetical protein
MLKKATFLIQNLFYYQSEKRQQLSNLNNFESELSTKSSRNKKKTVTAFIAYYGFCGEYRIRTDHLLPARQAL